MRIRYLLVPAVVAIMSMPIVAKSPVTAPGGLSTENIEKIRSAYKSSPDRKALHNAIAGTDIDVLALDAENKNNFDTYFSHRVPSKGITNQLKSGRCWLFTGLNVLRAQMMAEHDLPKLELSQCYGFFWDQLEKSNLFLQGIIDTASLPADDRKVDWLFANALSDGGQYTGVADILMKYGVVPIEVMGETASSKNTARMRQLLGWRLREDGLILRRLAAEGADKKALEARKLEMLGEVYRILTLNLGEPPVQFTWTRRDKDGNAVDTRTYTPQEFYQRFAGNDLKNDYVMLMNDPRASMAGCMKSSLTVMPTMAKTGPMSIFPPMKSRRWPSHRSRTTMPCTCRVTCRNISTATAECSTSPTMTTSRF